MNDSLVVTGIRKAIQESFLRIEEHLKTDVLVYYGGFIEGAEYQVKKIIEDLVKSNDNKDNKKSIHIILTTTGGSLNPVKRIVDILRHHYDEVNFIVPDYAYSAGTILCASGDKIYMSYFSVLGPIDPQIMTKDSKTVSALGYLDKIQEMLDKAKEGILTDAEFLILKDFDLAELRAYEQAKELAVDLLKTWLPKYKFKNWTKRKNGTKVTEDDKIKRAEEIAKKLGNNKIWKSHSRPININELRDLELVIDNLEDDKILYDLVTDYHDFMLDFVGRYNLRLFMQTRRFL